MKTPSRLGIVTATAALVLLLAPGLLALDPSRRLTQYNSKVWTAVEGLPQASVQAIAQTPDGYLWIGTRGGLVRFDGHAFTVFEPSTVPGLEGRSIQALSVAPDGALWIGTDGKGLTRFKDGVFRTLGPGEGTDGDSGNAILAQESGAVWFGTWAGVLRYDGTRTRRFDKRAGLPHDSVFGLAGDGKGTVWAATPDGLGVFRNGELVGTRRDLAGEPQCLLYDRQGVLWVGTSGGLDRIEGERIRHLTTRDGLLANFVSTLAEDRQGSLWIGTEGGLNRRSGERIEGISTAEGFPGNAVASLLEDREGNLWAGVRGVGLVRLREGVFSAFSKREGLSEDVVTCVFESKSGDLWFGTTHGLTRLRGGAFRTFTTRDGLLNDSVTGLGEMPDGTLLVATFARKLNLIRAERVRVFEPLTIETTVPSFLHVDRGGALWVGTLGAGLYRVAGGRIEHFPFRDSAGQAAIYAGLEDAAGALWFATPNGLLRYSDGAFESVTVMARGANRGVTYSLYEGADGALWVGTREDGVCQIAPGRAVRCFGRKDGLPEDSVYGVVGDRAGRLWMSGPRGVSTIPLADLVAYASGQIPKLSPQSFGISDGLLSDECQSQRWPSILRADDGRIWFPTSRGAAVVDPQRLGPPVLPPPTVIESVAVDGQALKAGPTSRFEAPPGRGGLEIRYASPTFRAPERVRFRYRLDGLDGDWVGPTAGRVARYTNLAPGTYRFRLAVSADGAIWSEPQTALEVRLAPHFHQTRTWYAFLLLLAGLALFGAYRWRVRHLAARAAELSHRVNEELANVRVLRGLIPICMSCKRIRSDEGFWQQIEAYISSHSEADFSHGICPECIPKLYPEYADEILANTAASTGTKHHDL